jgi:hypothetical protein
MSRFGAILFTFFARAWRFIKLDRAVSVTGARNPHAVELFKTYGKVSIKALRVSLRWRRLRT